MVWDDNKSTAADPENPTADEQLSADEWDAHVADQKGHASRHEKGGTDELVTFGDTVHDSIDSDQVTIGQTAGLSGEAAERPLISNGAMTLSVPQEYPTIQDAINEVPLHLRHNFTIEVDETQGPYNEDLIVPGLVAGDLYDTTQGSNARLRIVGQNGNAWEVDSVYAANCVGQGAVFLGDPTFNGVSPYANENGSCIQFGAGQMMVENPTFNDVATNTGATNPTGFLAYKGSLKIQGTVTLGTDNLSTAFAAKSAGTLIINTPNLSGSVTTVVFEVSRATILARRRDLISAPNIYDAGAGGIVQAQDEMAGFETLAENEIGFHRRNAALGTPESGVSFGYRADTSPPRLEAKDENGVTKTIVEF